MIRQIRLMLLVLLAALMASANAATGSKPAARSDAQTATTVSRGSVVAMRQQVVALSSQLRQLETQLAAAIDELSLAQAQHEEGLAPAEHVTQIRTEVNRLEEQMVVCRAALVDAQRLTALARAVDVKFKSASIRQAAEVLARVSGVPIVVDAGVSKKLYVNTQASGVPFGAVLEVIADAAHLIIVPSDNGGLLLRRPGNLKVNGKTVIYEGSNRPWNDDWGTVSAGYCPLGRRWLRLFDAAP